MSPLVKAENTLLRKDNRLDFISAEDVLLAQRIQVHRISQTSNSLWKKNGKNLSTRSFSKFIRSFII